jgi:hypothetical protein
LAADRPDIAQNPKVYPCPPERGTLVCLSVLVLIANVESLSRTVTPAPRLREDRLRGNEGVLRFRK